MKRVPYKSFCMARSLASSPPLVLWPYLEPEGENISLMYRVSGKKLWVGFRHLAGGIRAGEPVYLVACTASVIVDVLTASM